MSDAILKMNQNDELLRVAHPRECNNATNPPSHATTSATGAQQTGLKALALLALARNNPRNSDATQGEKQAKTAQQTPISGASFVARVAPDIEDVRERLLLIADSEIVDSEHINKLTIEDLQQCVDLADDTLRAYVRTLHDGHLRSIGKTPPGDTARAMCRHCGPVWIHPDIAACAPMVDGWARLLGCPSCHVRNRKILARPAIKCGECNHFIRDNVNPRDGIGSCGNGFDAEYPNASHRCASFTPAGDRHGN